jgi:hypothetical protein
MALPAWALPRFMLGDVDVFLKNKRFLRVGPTFFLGGYTNCFGLK